MQSLSKSSLKLELQCKKCWKYVSVYDSGIDMAGREDVKNR